jgi:hypothetical protein
VPVFTTVCRVIPTRGTSSAPRTTQRTILHVADVRGDVDRIVSPATPPGASRNGADGPNPPGPWRRHQHGLGGDQLVEIAAGPRSERRRR